MTPYSHGALWRDPVPAADQGGVQGPKERDGGVLCHPQTRQDCQGPRCEWGKVGGAAGFINAHLKLKQNSTLSSCFFAAFDASLDHAHVLMFHEWYETPKYIWVITELTSGGTLADILEQDGFIPFPRCSGVATLGHAGARALATGGRAPPVQR